MKEMETLHREVWERYVRRPFGHILDYADENGNTVYPTAEECRSCVPNVLSWTTPIENGAFFTGLYLYGLCERYDGAPDEGTKDEIDLLTKGLFLLCDISKVDGFIARGVAEDGVSHYPFSSEDQVGPWLLGLWRLRRSKACGEELRGEIDRRLLRTLRGVRAAGYRIPTEWKAADGSVIARGSYCHADWRGVCKGMFAAHLTEALDPAYEGEYAHIRDEKPDGALFTRLEIASHGLSHDMVRTTSLIQFWIFLCAHLCLRELARVDEENRAAFETGLFLDGVTAEKFLNRFGDYDETAKPLYEMDWRKILPECRSCTVPDEAYAEAGRQFGLFNKLCPARRVEHALLGDTIFASWLCITSGFEPVARKAKDALLAAAGTIDWSKVRCSYAFAAEAALVMAGVR